MKTKNTDEIEPNRSTHKYILGCKNAQKIEPNRSTHNSIFDCKNAQKIIIKSDSQKCCFISYKIFKVQSASNIGNEIK